MTDSAESHPTGRGKGRGRASGRGRGRGGRRGGQQVAESESAPSTDVVNLNRVHTNGAAEITFQVAAPEERTSDSSRVPEEPGQTADLSTQPRDAAFSQQESDPRAIPIRDLGYNPFLSDMGSRGAGAVPPAATGRAHINTRPSAELDDEHFPSPSPTSGSGSSQSSPTTTGRAGSTNRQTGRTTSAPAQNNNKQPEKRQKKRGAMDIWTFFREEGKRRFCIFCDQLHAINSAHALTFFGAESSTTTLRSHLAKQHIATWVDACDRLNISITASTVDKAIDTYRLKQGHVVSGTSKSDGNERPSDIPEYSFEALVDAITQFIIADDQSINVIESPYLRRVFMLLRKDLKESDIPHRTAIRNHIKEIWDDYILSLGQEIREALGKISLTTDLWTDPNLSPFMAVTAHWIQVQAKQTTEGLQYELKLRAEIIGFHRVPGHHDGEHLAQAFLYILDRITITSKIGWVTLDNASNNDTMMAELEKELNHRQIPFDRVENRIRCFPHIVNLACKAVVSALANMSYVEDEPDAAEPIGAVRSLVRAVRVSSLRRQHFAQICKSQNVQLQLLRDVDTRWSSILYMIDRALALEKPLDLACTSQDFPDLARYRLSSAQWDALAEVREILIVPEAFQQKLSAEKTPTLCNAVPAFDAMVSMWKSYQTDMGYPFDDAIQEGIDKLNAYHDRIRLVPAYTMSMFLNPVMKLNKIPMEQREEANTLIRNLLLPYFEKRTRTQRDSDTQSGRVRFQQFQPSQPFHAHDYTPQRSRTIGGRALRKSKAHRTADEILGLKKTNTTGTGSLDDEIQTYMVDSSKGTGSLTYWQENQLRYPTLFLAALDYLAIQGSAVPCERVFSSAKETMTQRRNRIGEDLMEMLQMLKFTLKSGGISLDFSVGTSEAEVIELIQTQMEAEDNVPQDINGFIQSLLSQVA